MNFMTIHLLCVLADFLPKRKKLLLTHISTTILGALALTVSVSVLAAPPKSVMDSESGNKVMCQCRYYTTHTHKLVNLLTASVQSDCFEDDPEAWVKGVLNSGEIDVDLALPDRTRCSLLHTASDSIQGIDSVSYKAVWDYLQDLPFTPTEEEQIALNHASRSNYIANVKWKTTQSGQNSCHGIFAMEVEQWAVNGASRQLVKTGVSAYLISGIRPVYSLISSATKKVLPDISVPYFPWIHIKAFSLVQVLVALGAVGVHVGISNMHRKAAIVDLE